MQGKNLRHLGRTNCSNMRIHIMLKLISLLRWVPISLFDHDICRINAVSESVMQDEVRLQPGLTIVSCPFIQIVLLITHNGFSNTNIKKNVLTPVNLIWEMYHRKHVGKNDTNKSVLLTLLLLLFSRKPHLSWLPEHKRNLNYDSMLKGTEEE